MASSSLVNHVHSSSCSCSPSSSAISQTLEELAFERSLSGVSQKGDVKKMEILLNKGHPVDGQSGHSLKAVDDQTGPNPKIGHTPLHYAARNGHVAACQLLLRHGARLDIRTAAGGSTALHSAVYGRNIEIVQMLLSKGACTMVQDADGMTALHKAWEMGETETAEMLERSCPSAAEIRDKRGRLPRECRV